MSTETVSVPQWLLPHRLRRSLEHAGMTAGEMADYLEVHRNTVSNWIYGHAKPPASAVKLWAMRTGVPYPWLATGQVDGPQRGGDGAAGVNGTPLTIIDHQGYGFWAGLLPFDDTRSRKPMGSRPPARVSVGSDISRLRRTLNTHPIVNRREDDTS